MEEPMANDPANDKATTQARLPQRTLAEWLEQLRDYQIAQTIRPATWEQLSKRQRLARARAIQGKYKDVLSPSTVMMRTKQDEIDRE